MFVLGQMNLQVSCLKAIVAKIKSKAGYYDHLNILYPPPIIIIIIIKGRKTRTIEVNAKFFLLQD